MRRREGQIALWVRLVREICIKEQPITVRDVITLRSALIYTDIYFSSLLLPLILVYRKERVVSF